VRVWVLGAEGLVGRALVAALRSAKVDCVATGKAECPITSQESVFSYMEKHRPTHIVNAAAYTDVDCAESNKALAFAVNAEGPELLGRVAKQGGVALMHLSSDYVFGLDCKQPCREEERGLPSGVYATSKWEGELRLRSVYDSACIVRTSWVFGSSGKNFLSILPNLLKTREEIEVDAVQQGRPTYVKDLARALIYLLSAQGTFHFANEGVCSRYVFAQALADVMKNQGVHTARIVPSYQNKGAGRPVYSVLDTAKIAGAFGCPPRFWKDTLIEIVL